MHDAEVTIVRQVPLFAPANPRHPNQNDFIEFLATDLMSLGAGSDKRRTSKDGQKLNERWSKLAKCDVKMAVMFTSAMSASSSATSQPSRLRPIGGRKTADAATCTRYIQRNKHTVAAGSSPLFACAETRAKCSITSALAKYISVTHSKAIHPHASNRLFYIGNIGSPGRNRTCIYRLGGGYSIR